MRMMNIASGSSGNVTFIGTDEVSLLVDVGISKKRIDTALAEIDMQLSDMDGIFITHEHADHVKGLGVIARKHSIPIYATYKTIEAVRSDKSLGAFDEELLRPIKNRESVVIGDMEVTAHPISHDAADPVCYAFTSAGRKAVIATDMGCYDDETVDFLSEADAMLIEANHDIRMLEAGPYPYSLKKRILGDRGHLSNESSGQLVRSLLNDHVKRIMLGHLSETNNYEDLAYEAVKAELAGNPYSEDVRDFGLTVCSHREHGELIEI